jgi:hypothetical protein
VLTSDASWQNVAGADRYQWVMTSPVSATNCILMAEFTMPKTNTAAHVWSFIDLADGASTTDKVCFKNHYEFANNKQAAGSNVAGWPYLSGSQCSGSGATFGSTTFTGAGAAFTEQTIQSNTTTGCLVSGPTTSTDCTGTACNGLKGAYFIERCQCGVDSGCGTATDAGSTGTGLSLFQGAHVLWTSP